jgi:sugar phosphate isomerase/epimerase
MVNLVSVSSAPIAKLGGSRYYDLLGTIAVMKRVWKESVVDGFELQVEPEWDSENPPLSDGQFADWTKTPKYSTTEVLEIVKRERLPVLSVHANRDIGGYLCSDRSQDREKGKRLIVDSLSLAQSLPSKVCTFHLWDTWKTNFDVQGLKEALFSLATGFPEVKASVENIPTHLDGYSPFRLCSLFDSVTLDLRWASMYKELNEFQSIIDKVTNVHLRGRLDGNRWFMEKSDFGFYEALDKIRNDWGYSGLLTLEPEGPMDQSNVDGFLEAMRSLRS